MRFRLQHIILTVFIGLVSGACGIYSFTGADIDYTTTKTFQVNNFVNNAPIVEPKVARNFTLELQDLLLNQTSLSLVNNNGDLVYEGEIVDYYVAPITATSKSTAAQNRLTIGINVRFSNTNAPEKDFEQKFTFYFDYSGSSQLIGSQLDIALEVIFERLTQDIFNKSLANW
ncbi:MAG: LptE family protein [Flavobacteriaceae bacterium]|nr:LptE family protein [Flavobacteriaceae bacterium]MDG1961664.1 LptE family protein [Flavobacteriaceae bacterium]